MTPAITATQKDAVKVAIGFKTECLKTGDRAKIAVADRLLRAIKALPAYELAEQAVVDTGHAGLPAAVIRELAAR